MYRTGYLRKIQGKCEQPSINMKIQTTVNITRLLIVLRLCTSQFQAPYLQEVNLSVITSFGSLFLNYSPKTKRQDHAAKQVAKNSAAAANFQRRLLQLQSLKHSEYTLRNNITSPCCIPETYIMLNTNYILINQLKLFFSSQEKQIFNSFLIM